MRAGHIACGCSGRVPTDTPLQFFFPPANALAKMLLGRQVEFILECWNRTTIFFNYYPPNHQRWYAKWKLSWNI